MNDETILLDCAQAALTRHADDRWAVEPGPFWCSVRPRDEHRREQGWKLHLSATPLSAPLVLTRVAPVLLRYGCPFKFAGTLERVRTLVSDRFDRGAGGKFLTAYPDCDDDQLRALAEELHAATVGLPGPGVLSDRAYRPDSLVHYRFGVFHGVTRLGNDGSFEAMLVAPDGELVQDRRRAWYSPPTWAPPDPFAPAPAPAGDVPHVRPVLLDGRFVVREAIRHAVKGGVFRAVDQCTGAPVIVKQARRHVGADLTGADARSRLRREADMLARFAPAGITPRPVALFEQQGDLFLVEEPVEGVSLREWIRRTVRFGTDEAWGPDPGLVTKIALALVSLMEHVHDAGFVLRDLNPNNVMVADDGGLQLIDLELLARPGTQVVKAYTPCYAPPEQLAAARVGPAPDLSADLFALGATLFHLVSGTDPLLAPDEPHRRDPIERIGPWLGLVAQHNLAARVLTPLITGLLDADPLRRPGLTEVRATLSAGPPRDPVTGGGRSAASPDDTGRMLIDAVDHLVATQRRDGLGRLWRSGEIGATTDPFNVQHGAAGVLGVLVRAHDVMPSEPLHAAVATAADRIRRHVLREPRMLPGLYFGRSGTAWALLEAGRLLGDPALADLAAELALRVPLRWSNPDICHGTAGAGLTQLRLWEHTGDARFLTRLRTCAEAVGDAAQHGDGRVHWTVPPEFASVFAGVTHHGFAHGTAGMGTFLLAAGRILDEAALVDLARAAAADLVAAASVEDGAARWTTGEPGSTRLLTHWCSGSSGIGTFLARLGNKTVMLD